ncbi:MAG: phosphopantetheine-binding protein [Planctomycetaceae bacterium]
MSSVVVSQTGAGPSAENGAVQIVHYDATVRRKEKMRHKASQEAPASAKAVPDNGVAHVAQPAAPEAVASVVAAATPMSAATATKPSNLNAEDLETFLVNFVVEQTGYPPEMVELDADLEADLGIDSIKKAQLFGEMAEHIDVQIEISEDTSLDDFPTLRHVMDFLSSAASNAGSNATSVAPVAVAPASAPVAPAPAPPAPPAAPPAGKRSADSLNVAELEPFLVTFVVEQTGYPPEMVDLDADLEADLGIDSIKKAQLFGELAEHLDVQIEISEDMSLDDFPTLRHVVDFLAAAQSPAAAKPAATPAPATTSAATPPAPIAAAQVRTPALSAIAPPASPAAIAAATPADGRTSVGSLSSEELEQFLVNFVVEQTGYPPEMVELDADLEADLGIDSIKKAQLFGELAENLDARVEVTEDMSLDDFPTLRHVMQFLATGGAKTTV